MAPADESIVRAVLGGKSYEDLPQRARDLITRSAWNVKVKEACARRRLRWDAVQGLRDACKESEYYALERGLASLRGDADALLGFASLVPPADLPKLVRESVSPAMLGAYAEATARAAERANEDAKALAHALATAKALAGVPRFAANAMMMKRADKETMRAALERVGGEDAREIADAWKL